MNKLYSDEQLIAFFVNGNIDAWHEFFYIYSNHAEVLSKKALNIYKGSGITYNEFYSIAIEAIVTALSRYVLYSCTFYPFYKQTVHNHFQAYVSQRSIELKRSGETFSLSLDDTVLDSSIKYEEIYGLNDPSIESEIHKKEVIHYILEKLKLLTEKEKQFFFYLLDGYEQKDIMSLLNMSNRQFYRMRAKIRDIIDLDIIKDYFH